ncbi:Cytosol aminopeptidase [Blattella germanica]|nr:Cytosol aminopeptidase [Blattella germanica]
MAGILRTELSSCLRGIRQVALPIIRRYSSTSANVPCGGGANKGRASKGIVLGAYTPIDENAEEVKFTDSGKKINKRTDGKLQEQIVMSGPHMNLGEARLFYGLDEEFPTIAVVGLGSDCLGYNEGEDMDEGKEAIRVAAALGTKALQKIKIHTVYIESFGHSESAAEGAALAAWVYQELKNKANQSHVPELELFDCVDYTGWHIGLQKAAAQNLARQLMDTPANIMTPRTFAQNAVEILCKSGINVEVKVQGWAETQKMGGFLSAAKGSCEPPIFLELSYYGTNYEERPIVLIGSGVTFDSGGLCLRKPHDMKNMRGDMGGAAYVVATTRAIAHLQLPLNIRGLIPLCENMPGCLACKPGDIVTCMNGKSVMIDYSDCEGRLAIADALYYAQNFWPRFILDIGTLTKDMDRGFGKSCTGVFTNSDALWHQMRMAGVHTGDRVWRLPLWNYFMKQVSTSPAVDVRNVGPGRGGGPCRCAGFLQNFVPCGEWIHMDAFGVMYANGTDEPYLSKGMSGRPTRTLIEFLSQLVCKCN